MPDSQRYFLRHDRGAECQPRRRSEFSAVELARAFAERLETTRSALQRAGAAAARAGARAARSEVDNEIKRDRWRGPLQGIPIGVKDLLSYAGQPTTWGAQPYAGQVFDYNATVVDQARQGAAQCSSANWRWWNWPAAPAYRYAAASLTGPGTESVGSHALVGRILERIRRSRWRRAGAVRDRLGNLGIDPHARGLLRRYRRCVPLMAW